MTLLSVVNGEENEGQTDSSVLRTFWESKLSNGRYLTVWKDAGSLCNETANVPSLPGRQTLLLPSSLHAAPCLLLRSPFFIPAPPLPPVNFHLFLPFPPPHSLLPSHSFSAHFYLSFHLSPPLQCSHLIIPSRNTQHIRITVLILDNILCGHICYYGQFLSSQGGQCLPCTQSTSEDALKKQSNSAYRQEVPI